MQNKLAHFPKALLVMAFHLIIALVAILASLVGAVLVAAAVADYRPADTEPVKPHGVSGNAANNGQIFSFLIWNIGYAGLGKESDLFHDGGKMVVTPKAAVEKNLEGVKNLMVKMQNVDFFLLQEVDKNSRRSYHKNQVGYLSEGLKDYNYTFATNYNAAFIPYPFAQPYGKVLSGLTTFSRYMPKESFRYALPSEYSWPVSMFFVKRCFLIQRYEVSSGKELVVINTHKSAYDTGGKVKKHQMLELKKIILAEYEKGNYVVVGGDWNQSPPGYLDENSQLSDPAINVPDDFMPKGWQWIFDDSSPTNRKMKAPYEEGQTPTQLLDFFLISPNIELIAASTISQNFEFSDHHPVYMRVQLK